MGNVTFEAGSELLCIEKKASCASKIRRVTIPDKCKLIGKACFEEYVQALNFEFHSRNLMIDALVNP